MTTHQVPESAQETSTAPCDIAKTDQPGDEFDPAYWLAIQQAKGIGARTFIKLLSAFTTPKSVIDASYRQLQETGLAAETIDSLEQPDWKAIQGYLNWLEEHGGQVLTLADNAYPATLKQIPDPPPLLFVLGNPDLLQQPQIAMVGSRNPTHTGAETAFEFAAELARAGLTITSGMALGVDGQCHQGALSVARHSLPADTGSTIAVIGTGIDRVYPARHKNLAERIACHGAIISEFPFSTPPLAQNFPLRNRIISGLSLGVVVVEAALQSGSLITARQALEQNREVFAIPGSIHSPQSRGCHQLIRNGAKLVETAEDIIQELQIEPKTASISHKEKSGNHDQNLISLDPEYAKLLDCVDYAPTPVDKIVSRCGLTADEVCSMLLILELENHVINTASGQYSRIK